MQNVIIPSVMAPLEKFQKLYDMNSVRKFTTDHDQIS
jgi:hypothetical protein